MSFIAITYGYNQYSIFNTNVVTNPLLDNIVSICFDDMITLLNTKLLTWEEQINNYNFEEEQIKKSTKKLETDEPISEEKSNEASKAKETGVANSIKNSNDNNNNNKKNNPKASAKSKHF